MIMSEDRDNIRELLSAYIDGETTPEQSRSVEQETARDPALALELHELTAAKRLVMGLERQRAPRGFVRKVMSTAERKHLLGDQQAGGAFSAARWITMAVAAMVLLTAGLGIFVISTLDQERGTPEDDIALVDGSSNDLDGGSLHDKPAGRNEIVVGKGGGGRTDGWVDGSRKKGKKVIVGDEAFDYAVSNARNTTIYTHEVSNTLAVLHKTLGRNDVQPLELEAPEGKIDNSGEKRRNVSRGELNFYYNNKQDAKQVQIVVLASDTVIEKLNGDIDKLASVQRVSQAPIGRSRGSISAKSGPGSHARRSGYTPGKSTAGELEEPDATLALATKKQVGGPADDNSGAAGTGVASKALQPAKKDKDTPRKPAGKDVKPSAPVRALTPDPTPTPEAEAVVVTKPPAPKEKAPSVVAVPVTDPKAKAAKAAKAARPGLGQITPGIQKNILVVKPADADEGELSKLSSQITMEQKKQSSDKKIESQYGIINRAFRQRILSDNIRRDVQSQQEKGVNVQALVININLRGLKAAGVAEAIDKALSKPRATTTSSPAAEPATRQSTPSVDTSE
jgi:hypothetical protein